LHQRGATQTSIATFRRFKDITTANQGGRYAQLRPVGEVRGRQLGDVGYSLRFEEFTFPYSEERSPAVPVLR
jgi:hypothetical protein